MNLFTILISTIFVNNYVFARFLGICPLLGVSNKTETATGMGIAVTFVITMSSVITFMINKYILVKLEIEYLQTIVFILVIAALVQLVEIILKKNMPNLYEALGVYLPLITTNCIVLGVALINVREMETLLEALFNGLGSSIGFILAIVLLAAVRERLEVADTPEAFKGFPIALISVGLMSVAFLGFSGLV